jgi:hypothetical protein
MKSFCDSLRRGGGLHHLKKTARFMFQKVKYLFLPYERTKLCIRF